MVLEEEFFPHGHGGYQKQGYGLDYCSNNGYGNKEDYYPPHSYYGNSSGVPIVRPNITTPEPAKQFVVGSDSHGYEKESSGGYGKQYQNNHHDHDMTYGHGFPAGGTPHHGDGMFGKTCHMQGGYNDYGQQIHGYPKPNSPFGGGNFEYEREHGSYMQKEPGRYESVSYGYYGEGRNRCPTPSYYGQESHISNYNNKNHHWAAAKGGAEWISKGL